MCIRDRGVSVSEIDKGKFTFNAKNIDLNYLNSSGFANDAKSLRGSIMLVGPLLSRLVLLQYLGLVVTKLVGED